MSDDGMPPKSASDASVVRHAGSCWAVDEAVGDGLLGIEVPADQLVDDECRVGRVDAVAADPVGDHRERVGNIRVRHLRPAVRDGQHDVERLEVAGDLRLELDALLLEEVAATCTEVAGSERFRRRGGGDQPGAVAGLGSG